MTAVPVRGSFGDRHDGGWHAGRHGNGMRATNEHAYLGKNGGCVHQQHGILQVGA